MENACGGGGKNFEFRYFILNPYNL